MSAWSDPKTRPTHIREGDRVWHRGSCTGVGEIREIFFVFGKPKQGGPRWRAWVLFPQNRSSEVGGVGREVVQAVDVEQLRRCDEPQQPGLF